MKLRALAMLAALHAGCAHTSSTPPLTEQLSANRDAEQELRQARDLEDRGESAQAAQSYQRFIDTFADDPLALEAEFGLGRLLLADGDVQSALSRFDHVALTAPPALLDRVNLYRGVAMQIGSDATNALAVLDPLVGKLTLPADVLLLRRTLAAVYETLAEPKRMLDTLDALLGNDVPAAERAGAQARAEMLVNEELTSEQVDELVHTIATTQHVWPLLAMRALREAAARQDNEAVRTLATQLRARHIQLPDELMTLVVRAELPATADPNAIGLLLPLSGRSRDIGQAALRGALVVHAVATDGPLSPTQTRLVPRDTGSDPERVARAVDDLVTLHRVIAIVGPAEPRECAAAAARARDWGIPILTLCSGGDLESAGPWVFRMLPTVQTEVFALIEAAFASGARRFSIARPETTYGHVVELALTARVRALGGTLVRAERYPAGSTHFHDLAATLAVDNVDAVLIADQPRTTESLILSLRAAAARQGSQPRILLTSVCSTPATLATLGHNIEGAFIAAVFDPEQSSAAFTETYRRANDAAPSSFSALAHDAVEIIEESVRQGASTREQVGNVLRDRTVSGSVTGLTRFAQDRSPLGVVRILTVRNGRAVSAQ